MRMKTSRENTPLIHPRVVRKYLQTMVVPDDLNQRIAEVEKIARELRLGRLDEVKETSFHAEFAAPIFANALGYRRRTNAVDDCWELESEKTIPGTSQEADLALGFFGHKRRDRIVAPVELKGAKQSLDRRGSRRRTPVEQARDYASETPGASWYLVSNYREIRLYHLAHVSQRYERFEVERLTERDEFLRFYLLLARPHFLPGEFSANKETSLLDQMLTESVDVEHELTDQLYDDYSLVRRHVFEALRNTHSERDPFDLLRQTQKLLDRVLFAAFAEDRGLLPTHTLKRAFEHDDPYHPRPKWENFKAIFHAIDVGNASLGIPAYNGGLFAPDAAIDALELSDEVCEQFARISGYDFEADVSVTVLGHIFEQSITDLEEMREKIDLDEDVGVSKRKKEGVYYTPDYITRFIVEAAIGAVLDERRTACFERVFAADTLKGKYEKTKRLAALEAWQKELPTIRVIDPACGSGAFLIAAFDYLSEQYQEVETELAELRGGQASLLNWNDTILRNNLFGVDLNPESVEITRLSLWLKTVRRGEALTALDANIQVGNSVVGDLAIDPRAFDWSDAFAPETFDVVIGNPPYVRHEYLGESKAYFKKHYKAYAGTADLYVYFYELGLRLLKPGGRLSYIVTNKWLRSGYGEGLRRLFATRSVLERIVDFGHAPIFKDADTFPCIVVNRKVLAQGDTKPEPDFQVEVCEMPREELKDADIATYVAKNCHHVLWSRFTSEAWSLEPVAVDDLMGKMREVGEPLSHYLTDIQAYRGVVTGCNEVFLIDQEIRDCLLSKDPKSSEIIKPYVGGRNVGRWQLDRPKQYMIFTRRGIDIEAYPAVLEYLKLFRDQLEPKPPDWDKEQKETGSNRKWRGRKGGSYAWYEIQDSVDYYQVFEQPKIFHRDICWRSEFSFTTDEVYCSNSAYVWPTSDLYLLGVINSPLMWAYMWRNMQHGKDEALRLFTASMKLLPIAKPTDTQRLIIESSVAKLLKNTDDENALTTQMLDWLTHTHGIKKHGNKLLDFASLSREEFAKEVGKRRAKAKGKLSSGELREVLGEYDDIAEQVKKLRGQKLQLEYAISDAVMDAYQLSDDERRLVWDTAPPRMPLPRPARFHSNRKNVSEMKTNAAVEET